MGNRGPRFKGRLTVTKPWTVQGSPQFQALVFCDLDVATLRTLRAWWKNGGEQAVMPPGGRRGLGRNHGGGLVTLRARSDSLSGPTLARRKCCLISPCARRAAHARSFICSQIFGGTETRRAGSADLESAIHRDSEAVSCGCWPRR
jgi:hypothetical protein